MGPAPFLCPSRWLSVLFFGIIACLSDLTWAQSRPLPGSIPVPSLPDRPDEADALPPPRQHKDSGYLRIWNYGYSIADSGLAFLLSPTGRSGSEAGERQWLARGVRAPTIREYREIPSGKYQLLAVRDRSRAGDPDPALNEDDLSAITVAQLDLVIESDSFQTVLARDSPGSSLLLQEISDSETKVPQLRIFIFSPEARPTFTLVSGSERKVFLHELKSPQTTVDLSSSNEPLLIEITSISPRGLPVQHTARIGGQNVKSYSLLIGPNRYGRTTVRATADAPMIPPPSPSPSPTLAPETP